MGSSLFRIVYCDGRVEERAFGDGRVRIGRESGDLVLADPSSSGVHGELAISGASVTYTDLGSSNGSFDAQNQRLTLPLALLPNSSVRLGRSVITFLRSAQPGPARTEQMPEPSALRAEPRAPAESLPRTAPPAPIAGVRASGVHSHPDRDVRHSYPIAHRTAGIGAAVSLLMKTMPFLLARLGVLTALTVAGIVYAVVLVGGFVYLGRLTPLLGWAWLVALGVVAGSIWRFAVRYVLYLIKAAHIAVLTELITTGSIANGNESMFHYGKRIVTERFGEVNVMFGLDMLIDGIVGAFNRTLDWVANLLPVPGLDSVMGVVRAVLRASTTYIDETIFSYNLARGDDNVYRSSKDGLIYYAQNAKEVLKVGVWAVVLDKVLTFLIWVVMLGPAFVLASFMPGWATLLGLVFASMFAADVRSAFLRPLFLTMVMVEFHTRIQNQPIHLEWDQRLSGASDKFQELGHRAASWVRPGKVREPAPAVQPA
jgi:hypothetical protein